MQEPSTVLNRKASLPARRTYVVMGLHRGGTTMVAGALRRLGIFMGERLDPRGNEEDLDFQGATPERSREAARRRDAAHDVWGFKDPGAYLRLLEWQDELRVPCFVVVFRDLLASAQTELRAGNYGGVVETLAMKLEQTARIVEFVVRAARDGRPLLLVSYERALLDPHAFVAALVDFAGVAAEPDRIAAVRDWIDPRRGYGTPGGRPPR